MKGASERVDRAVAAMRAAAQKLTPEDCEGDTTLVANIATAMRQAASLLELRFKYLKIAPWCFSNADSMEGAACFLSSATSRPLGEQDVLTQYLYSTHCEDLKAVAAGGVCSEALSEEVKTINETPMDESAGEGYHRGTHLTRIRARASKMPYVKMSTRVQQTLRHLKSLIKKGPEGKRVLRYEWRHWSRVVQTKRRSLWRKKHWPAKKVFERVYRMDEFSEEHWSSVAATIPAPGQGPPPGSDSRREADSQMVALRVEYLQDVLKPQEWYRVDVPVTGQDEHGAVVHRTEQRYLQLLQKTSARSRPKLMPTVESWEDPVLRYKLALNIQESSVRPLPEEAGAEGLLLVYPDANPRWVGHEDICPWTAMVNTLTRFTDVQGMAEHPGCLSLASPEPAKPIHPLTDFKCPTLSILLELYRLGWKPVRGTCVHDSIACGVIDGREAVKMKAYYIVILEIARCMPLSSTIPSDQPIAYYKLLLAGRNVEPGLGNPEYKRLLREGPEIAPPAIEDPVFLAN